MNPWLIVGFVLAVVTAGGVGMYQGRELGMAKVQQEWDSEKTQQYEAYAIAQDAARLREQALQASADMLRKDKDAEIRNLNARAAALTNSLRERPSRSTTNSSPVPDTASVGPAPASCTGSGLSREDAEFLAGEAARADELRASLRQCIAQYSTLIPK